MPLANVHTPFFYLFSETCVDNSLSLQRAMTPFSSFPCFYQKYRSLGILAFVTRHTQILGSLLQASLNIFSICNGGQLPACTFDVTWLPEFPSNNIFARDWAVSRHSVGETMFKSRGRGSRAIVMSGQKLLFNCTLYFGRINYVTLANWTTKQNSWENSWIIPTY